MRKKLQDFLTTNGFEVQFIKTLYCNFDGGRSFYNDGRYKDELYVIKKNQETYNFYDKITGRPYFKMRDMQGNLLELGFSQQQFIERLTYFFTEKGLLKSI